jgi:hypothetical protein
MILFSWTAVSGRSLEAWPWQIRFVSATRQYVSAQVELGRLYRSVAKTIASDFLRSTPRQPELFQGNLALPGKFCRPNLTDRMTCLNYSMAIRNGLCNPTDP